MKRGKCRIALLLLWLLPAFLLAETGENLWLRYVPLNDTLQSYYGDHIKNLMVKEDGEVADAAENEFKMAYAGLTGRALKTVGKPVAGTLVMATVDNPVLKDFNLSALLSSCGDEGYVIKNFVVKGGSVLVMAANNQAGLLYGTFGLIRMMQTGDKLDGLEVIETPSYHLRMLNHWDNLNGTVERGYAGHSIWWNRTEDEAALNKDYTIYARANASVGINGTVLNNVNAAPEVLTTEYLQRYAAIAAVLRPYNIKVFMSVNMASPAVIGNLKNSDPLNPDVVNWWENKVKEIYQIIPDFGGFLVKANSEGQPGPQDYGRTHADGANLLAKALKPYNGVVMWRAFVYEPGNEDRARQAFSEFKPFDGQFEENVIIQVKNGPVDFQPREPFSPLFGAMEKTPLMVEFQITQEYLGFSNHLAYLSTMWEETLDADTWCKGSGSTVAKTTDGSIFQHKLTAIAGVANIGRDVNWTGHHFAQSNWYAFGRLAWNNQLPSHQIAYEWINMTFTHDEAFVKPVKEIMMQSREAVVNYMTPLGLHHLMGWSHHHGPEPWTDIPGARPDWLPSYYHKASTDGIGFNRSSTGSNAVAQYFSPVRELYNHPATCPENLLLWFHHLPWDYRLQSGETLWDALCYAYYDGVEDVRSFQKQWDTLEGMIDADRFKHIQHKMKVQTREAIWWRDACILYFQTFSGKPIPYELERPIHDLDELKKIKFDMTHHN